VRLRFKDTHPDNIMDLQVADVLLTNYSSIANLFYATRRPTVHIYPVRSDDEAFMWRKFTALGVIKTKVRDARFVWKLDPEDHGGLMARSFDETLAALDTAIDKPGCCKEAADDFLALHMHGADGQAGARALASLRELTNETMQR
jgi:CDP-glycerol glycerophosphotransferase (TagB/SpsB family)